MGDVERRGLLTGPAYINLDASIVKIVRFGTRRAEIRADFFNALNIPHYVNPNGTLGNANFDRITAILAQTERVIRFGGRVLSDRGTPTRDQEVRGFGSKQEFLDRKVVHSSWSS